ncbi:hypothetical protein CASFOL_039066 [Castilleja foliolosa]|uniref:Uncharacterized protein n=1 Tax=Castilleja foliolosa TaxID=1961234 RepID=A0ABD3BHC7_9LAMI
MISDAVGKVEPDGVLSIESSSSFETTVDVKEGMEPDSVIRVILKQSKSPSSTRASEPQYSSKYSSFVACGELLQIVERTIQTMKD